MYMFQFLYKFLDYNLGVNMTYEIKSFVGTCSYAQLQRLPIPNYTIEDYELKMETLMKKKKERKYTM
jgi:hypothetical protein